MNTNWFFPGNLCIFPTQLILMKKTYILLTATALVMTFPAFGQEDVQKELQTQFVMAEAGEVIKIPAGHFTLTKSLWLDQGENVTIRGAGMDKTVLSFAGQTEGAEGIKVTGGQHILIEGLTVQDAKGDAIKTQDVNGITFREVKTEWSGAPKETNGAYGLYPVLCQNVLIESCESIGASDAGIYVGQSKNIIVRNSTAHHNVTGIEIENSQVADVYNNVTHDNTGGILIFDLPNLVQKKGGHVRVFDNEVRENNHENFAPQGNIVAGVTPGTGILILATSDVEVFNNRIINNRTAGTSIISYYMTEQPITDKLYDPYPKRISIHDNLYEREAVEASDQTRTGKIYRDQLKFGTDVPHIVWDGILPEDALNKNGQVKDQYQICIRNNTNGSFANLDAQGGFQNISRDLSAYDCTLQSLEAADLALEDK